MFKLKKRYLPNKYVLLAGLAGLLPDIDLIPSLLLVGSSGLHRTITHSLVFPAIFFIGFLVFCFLKRKKLYKIFLMLFIGFFIHILLDFSLLGTVYLLFPFSFTEFGLNLLAPLEPFGLEIFAMIDAILLFFWLIHEELEHKISDYL